jgi:hypothetical protein
MEVLRWKARIAVLWISAAVAMSAHMILMVLDPTVLKKAGEWAVTAGEGEWMFTALFWLGPLWLAFAAVTVEGAVGRWLQVVAAIFFTGLGVWHFFVCGVPLLKGGPFREPVAHHAALVGSTAVAAGLIGWYAWKRPKE